MALSSANATTFKNIVTPPAGTPGKVKLVITPGENINLGKLDLLIVVDDSGSMSSHQTILSRSVPALAAKLANFSSLNVAVITSDMDSSSKKGKFFGSPGVLTNTTPNFKDLLARRIISVGTNGSGTEMFFAPVIAATSAPLINGPNAGFLREDAHLGVVVVTDTDDQSPNTTPEQFIIHLASMKGNNYSLINFIADPTDRNCDSQNPGKMPERLQLAKYMSNGSQYNICTGKFAEGISDVANKVERELNHKIALPMKPDVTTMTVTYGALTFPANDAVNGWTYDEPNNTLLLGEKIDFNVLPKADLVIEFIVK
jgi:hypothetical protein